MSDVAPCKNPACPNMIAAALASHGWNRRPVLYCSRMCARSANQARSDRKRAERRKARNQSSATVVSSNEVDCD